MGRALEAIQAWKGQVSLRPGVPPQFSPCDECASTILHGSSYYVLVLCAYFPDDKIRAHRMVVCPSCAQAVRVARALAAGPWEWKQGE